jgi:hypothetical protein
MIPRSKTWLSIGAALALSAGSLAACSGEREAESETPVAEAEVKTDLPEEAMSDAQLQGAADAAAAAASTTSPAMQQGAAMPAGTTSTTTDPGMGAGPSNPAPGAAATSTTTTRPAQ